MTEKIRRIAVVTGGSRGIGLATVKELVAKGYACIVASRSVTEEIKGLEESGSVIFVPCDISSAKDRAALISKAAALGGIDLLVNCAGVAPKERRDILNVTEEDFDYVMDINLKGTFFVSQAAAAVMAKQKSGRIINISSVSSYTSSTNRAAYCLSKAGISMMTRLFADRMAEENVYVFEISPGIIETDMTAAVKEKYQKMIDGGLTPTRRMGTPMDVAKCVCAVADGAFDFCTGTVINADGGFHIRRL